MDICPTEHALCTVVSNMLGIAALRCVRSPCVGVLHTSVHAYACLNSWQAFVTLQLSIPTFFQ